MRKRDDSSLAPSQYEQVRAAAERALRDAGAMGFFPTPIDSVMVVAKVHEVKEDVLNESFVQKLRKEVSGALKSALKKVMGLFDARSRLIFIDRSLHIVKQTFIRLHETAHAYLPWQRDLYAIVEDCEQTIDPELADQFDREANVFASEVLFQLDTFTNESEAFEFGILVPVKLSGKYGASIYSAVRRYVTQNWRACCVVVLNPPELIVGDGFRATFRRSCSSPAFQEVFGTIQWPDAFTPGDKIGAMVPVGKRRMSGKREISLRDANGEIHECVAEAFTQTHQVFILIHAIKTLTRRSIILA